MGGYPLPPSPHLKQGLRNTTHFIRTTHFFWDGASARLASSAKALAEGVANGK